MHNATDDTIFTFAEMAGGGEIRLGGMQSEITGSVPDPCQRHPLFARHTDLELGLNPIRLEDQLIEKGRRAGRVHRQRVIKPVNQLETHDVQ